MSKAYSNKALPPGTILREWRLEQVLGVGGFGIVYKGRGIYFDELVAIKEYFPSSISERDEDATVVPIDSDAEEVHALGLKKFVEEAKLLWNLSTPTRHPNIVSVRSLFEIHGTAYMVMDFEDGVSLSKLLKQGKKWDEKSLAALIHPISEGLERAHRVGVLHRDIKPPNILVNDDGRPVLIDFGSARFESGEATSTKVTFHTPPYAAIEQYVKTYEQGPWTDVYALGVVLYECITGEKPPEVLERMHAGLGKPLSEGDWPGYSPSFLAAVDAAMKIKPSERPQSISKWLELFDRPVAAAPAIDDFEDTDDDATRIADYSSSAPEELVHVVTEEPVEPLPTLGETGVPNDPKDVTFKRAGEDTGTARKQAEEPKAPVKEEAAPPPPASVAKAEAAPKASPAKDTPAKQATAKVAEKPKAAATGKPATPGAKKPPSPLLIGGAVAALLVVGGGVWYATQDGSGGEPDAALLAGETPAEEAIVEAVDIAQEGGITGAVQSLIDDARRQGASTDAIKALTDATAALTRIDQEIKALGSDTAAVKVKEDEQSTIARTASARFSAAILAGADARTRRLAAQHPWANPANPGAAAGATAERQGIARDIRNALGGIRAAAGNAAKATDPAAALTLARTAMARNASLNALIARAGRTSDSGPAAPVSEGASAPAAASGENAPAAAADTPGSGEPANDGQRRQLKSIVDSAKDLSKQVIRLGTRDKPGSNASKEEQDAYAIRQTNMNTAQRYEDYLDTLTNSMRGARTKGEADQLISSANTTKGYLQQMLNQSRASLD